MQKAGVSEYKHSFVIKAIIKQINILCPIFQENKGNIEQNNSSYYTRWTKTKSISPKFMNATRASTF